MAGLRRPAFIADFPSLKTDLFKDEVDFLLISISAKGYSAAGRTVKAIRNGQLGRDPFLPVMVVADSPNAEEAALLIDSGVDGVLVRPLSVGKITDRLRRLTLHRQPFVVTSDYIGPDRRTAPREPKPGEVVVPLLPVPNALHDRIVANLPLAARNAPRAAAWEEVMRQRLFRCADSMRLLAGRSFPLAMQGDINDRVLEDMRRIADLAEVAWKRLETEGQEPLARHLNDVATRMRAFVSAPASVERDGLSLLHSDIGKSHHGLSAFLAGAVAETPRL